jgi:hypothetical protein
LVSVRCVKPKLWDIYDVEPVGFKYPEGESIRVEVSCARVEDIIVLAVKCSFMVGVGR